MSEEFSIGINWYDPGELDFERDKNGGFRQDDGKYRDFTGVEDFDPDIAKALSALKEKHSIRMLEELKLINNAVYYNKTVPRGREERENWHRAALKKLRKCDIVFLDPDNGLLCDSVKPGSPKSVKYTYYSEVRDYLEENKTVIIYNHRSRKREEMYFNDIIEKLCSKAGAQRELIQVVTFRRFSVRDYFIISRDKVVHSTIKRLIEKAAKNTSDGKKQFCTVSDMN